EMSDKLPYVAVGSDEATEKSEDLPNGQRMSGEWLASGWQMAGERLANGRMKGLVKLQFGGHLAHIWSTSESFYLRWPQLGGKDEGESAEQTEQTERPELFMRFPSYLIFVPSVPRSLLTFHMDKAGTCLHSNVTGRAEAKRGDLGTAVSAEFKNDRLQSRPDRQGSRMCPLILRELGLIQGRRND